MIDGPLLSQAACGPHRPGCCTRRNSTPYELGQRTSFWVAAGVVAHTLWTSAAPAMTYPLFAEEWHLTHTVTTGVFAIYPIVVAAVLVGFGDVSDYIGRRAAILWGVGASLVGTLLFALAPDVLWLFAGRAFMGIGVGLTERLRADASGDRHIQAGHPHGRLATPKSPAGAIDPMRDEAGSRANHRRTITNTEYGGVCGVVPPPGAARCLLARVRALARLKLKRLTVKRTSGHARRWEPRVDARGQGHLA
jgi:hypothetical protein